MKTTLITKIFSRKRQSGPEFQNDQTIPAIYRGSQHKEKVTPKVYPGQFTIGSGQSVGMQRNHNEDAIYSMSSVIADKSQGLPFAFCIIADGMGGHKNGEIASGVAIRAAVRVVYQELYLKWIQDQDGIRDDEIKSVLEKAVQEAQSAVLRSAPGGGTTLVLSVMIAEKGFIAHVGDSRGYLISADGGMTRLTKDHSLVQRMVDLEEISEEEAFNHPQKNVLLRAIGQPEPFPVDTSSFEILPGGKLILCSDGLWGVVPESEFSMLVNSPDDPILISKALVDAANARGGPDNISVVLVSFPS